MSWESHLRGHPPRPHEHHQRAASAATAGRTNAVSRRVARLNNLMLLVLTPKYELRHPQLKCRLAVRCKNQHYTASKFAHRICISGCEAQYLDAFQLDSCLTDEPEI